MMNAPMNRKTVAEPNGARDVVGVPDADQDDQDDADQAADRDRYRPP